MSLTYLFAAYMIIWVLIFAYNLSLGKRQKNMAKELDLLLEQLEN